MQVTKLEYKQALTITDNFENQILSIIAYFDKASEEDRKLIVDNKNNYQIDKLLLPIIESRQEEMRNKGKKKTIKQILKKKLDSNS